MVVSCGEEDKNPMVGEEAAAFEAQSAVGAGDEGVEWWGLSGVHGVELGIDLVA
jgi:hypothetical protein